MYITRPTELRWSAITPLKSVTDQEVDIDQGSSGSCWRLVFAQSTRVFGWMRWMFFLFPAEYSADCETVNVVHFISFSLLSQHLIFVQMFWDRNRSADKVSLKNVGSIVLRCSPLGAFIVPHLYSNFLLHYPKCFWDRCVVSTDITEFSCIDWFLVLPNKIYGPNKGKSWWYMMIENKYSNSNVL